MHRFRQAVMFFSESKGTHLLTWDWPLRLLITACWTELREMLRSLACALIDLVGFTLMLFLRRERSLVVLTVHVLSFLDLLSSGGAVFKSFFYSVDEVTRHASEGNDVISLVSSTKKNSHLPLLSVTTIILKIITNCL